MTMLTPKNENSHRDHVTGIVMLQRLKQKVAWQLLLGKPKSFMSQKMMVFLILECLGGGTWRRRDYSSAYRVVIALSAVPGKVLDVEIMPKECSVYGLEREKKLEFQEWWEGCEHLCQVYHFGSSGSMDASGILSMFKHSVEVYSARYTEYIAYGDSKAHKLIAEQAVYGDLEVTNLECVAHVHKRLRLRLHH